MSFGREKRLLVGWLALLAPVPLPFNEVLEWPFLGLYLVLVGLFLRRAGQDPTGWLPGWAMNLLGLAYLPFLWVDFAARWNGQLVRPVVHLAMFAVVVKLFALRREKDKWQTLFGVFFLFLASMATSVHPTIILYVVAFLTVTLVLLTRFSLFSVLARFGYREWSLRKVPLGGFIAASTLLSILLGIPLFAVLPRIKSPYIMGRGVGTGTVIQASGFSDEVSLDSIGSIRQSRAVAMRLAFDPESRPKQEVRLKAATYEVYDGRSWRQSRPGRSRTPTGPSGFRLSDQPVGQWMDVWLQPLRSKRLPLPVQAAQVDLRATVLNFDQGGAASLLFPPAQIVEYRVGLSSRGEVLLADPPADESDGATLDTGGLTPAIREFAARHAGDGSPFEQARALEGLLTTDFSYTTDLVGRTLDDPVEDFLLRTQEGHCEYFATAMVLMLRSRGIPARLVTGFLGAEENRFENYYVVRQSNAHAWVEAYLPDEGWVTLDPTPPGGRPGVQPQSMGLLAGQVWDYLSFRWDRYVLTFGFYDQYRIASRLRSLWQSLVGRWSRDQPSQPQVAEVPIEVSEAADDQGPEPPWRPGVIVLVASWVVLGAVLFVLWRRTRRPVTATGAYLRLRGRMASAGVEVPDSLGPIAFQRSVAGTFPELEGPTSTVTGLYLLESFGGRQLDDEDRRDLVGSLDQVEEGLRRAG